MVGRIVRADKNLMTFANLGLAVGPTLFPSVPLQCCGQILELLSGDYAALWPDAPRSPVVTIRQF